MRYNAILGLAVALTVSAPALAKKKQPAPCVVYFAIAENDEVTVHLSMEGLNKSQSHWYEKHGDRDKYAGICYVPKVSEAPAAAPLYAVVWGEHRVSQPYVWTSTQQTNGTVEGTATDQNGNPSTVQGTTTSSVPVTESGVDSYHVADGWLAIWDSTADSPSGKGKGNFVPVGPLHNHNGNYPWIRMTVGTELSSASTSLLKDALEQIREREKQRLSSASR